MDIQHFEVHFRILVIPPPIDIDEQAHLPPALTAIHNFIQKHDPHDLHDYENENVEDLQPGIVDGGAEGQ